MASASDHDLSAHAHHEDEEEHNRGGERRTLYVVLLTLVMMIGELIVGYLTGSTALKADGWHMGTHVGALGLTLAAYWYARRHAGNDVFSFGTGKVYALAGYTSGVVLAIVALLIAKEGIDHLIHFEEVDYTEALTVAVIGLVVNLASALLLQGGHHYGHGHRHGHAHHHAHDHGDGHDHDHDHDHGHGHGGGHDDGRHTAHDHVKVEGGTGKVEPGTLDFNLRAAYIHVLADAFTSLLAIVALSLGKWADLWYLDPLMGPIGGAVILWWSITLCRQASGQLLDVTSSGKHEDVVRRRLEAIDDVRVADLHVWELGPGRRSCIVSLVTATPRDVDFYRDAVLTALPVAHLTIEIHRCELPHTELDRKQESAHQH